MINARSETVLEKPSFREAFKRRRCLIPATGFYEWKREANHKQPYYFQMKDARPFAFAGLWEQWRSGGGAMTAATGGKTIESCTILTTEANEVLAPVHERMPVILPAVDYKLWLDTRVMDASELMSLLHPYPAHEMSAHRVSTSVNNAKSQGAELIAPLVNSK